MGAILSKLVQKKTMLRISKKTDYALILLAHLGEAVDHVSAQKVAMQYKLPIQWWPIYLNNWFLPD